MGHMFGDVKPIDASLIFIFRSCFFFFFCKRVEKMFLYIYLCLSPLAQWCVPRAFRLKTKQAPATRM